MTRRHPIPARPLWTTCVVALGTTIATLLIPWTADAEPAPAPVPAVSAADSPCDAAAEAAARTTGVPVGILRTIARVETGRMQAGQLAPWPWALNIGGRGYWPETHQSALSLLQRHLSSGNRNVDVGCFQLNHRWHGDAFATVEQMLEPRLNALYAARFLARLHTEFGQWDAAVAAYHSRTLRHGDRYLARYRQVRATLADTPAQPARIDPPPSTPAPSRALQVASRPALFATTQGAAAPLFSNVTVSALRTGHP